MSSGSVTPSLTLPACAGRRCVGDPGRLLQPDMEGHEHGADRLLGRSVADVHGGHLRYNPTTHAHLDGEVERNPHHLVAQIGAVGSQCDRTNLGMRVV